MTLHKKIVAARKLKGLTQEQLADQTHVTVRTIQRIESGASMPRDYTLKAIATALDINFETLKVSSLEHNDRVIPLDATTGFEEADGKHFLQMLCLSCFSYLVIPFVHFLVPTRMLRKSKEQLPQEVIAFARSVIRGQLYWKAAFWFLMLLTVAYNLINAYFFEDIYFINYLWPFFFMYFINAFIISAHLLQLKKLRFPFQPPIAIG